MNDLLEEIQKRRQTYSTIRYISICGGLIFAALLVDFIFFGRAYQENLIGIEDPVQALLIMGWFSFNMHFYFDFKTDKLGNMKNIPLVSKFGIVGFNVVCLGHIFGFISS